MNEDIERLREIVLENNFNWRLIVSKIKKDKNILTYIQNFTKNYPKNINYKNRIILTLCERQEYLRCKQCNKILEKNIFISMNEKTLKDLKNYIKNLNFFCCSKCSALYTSQLVKRTCLKKYGVENPAKLKSIQNKIKQTMKKKYGVEHALQSKEILNKMKKRNFEKYGTEHPIKLKEVQNKIRQTCLEKYGVLHQNQNKGIQNKIRQTCLKKYGVDNPIKNAIVKNKLIQTIHNKTLKNIIKHCKLQNIEFISETYEGSTYDLIYKWKCLKCGNIFKKYYHSGIIPKCPVCYPIKNNSYQQYEIIDFIKSLNVNDIDINTRKIIPPKELDIYCPDYNIAIEYNGLYWHSNEYKDKNYHRNKTLECMKKNIRLIHIFEDEWVNKKQIIKNKLKVLFNKIKYKIPGRKCIIKEIDNELKDKFLNKYHLQGTDKSSIRLGAFYKNRLVAVMTFGKPRFNKKYEWELLRFCIINNFIVHGIASKLLSFFKKYYKPKSIITYADLRYSYGDLYKKLNFKYLGITDPNYFYVKNDIFRHNRIEFQKHKLKDKLEFYNENLTEQENMILNGYSIIYDCGNMKFEIIL